MSEQALRDHVRARLAAFNVPTHVWIREQELPRNPAGKVLKTELKRELIGEPAP